jgi:hypothetical protein
VCGGGGSIVVEVVGFVLEGREGGRGGREGREVRGVI